MNNMQQSNFQFSHLTTHHIYEYRINFPILESKTRTKKEKQTITMESVQIPNPNTLSINWSTWVFHLKTKVSNVNSPLIQPMLSLHFLLWWAFQKVKSWQTTKPKDTNFLSRNWPQIGLSPKTKGSNLNYLKLLPSLFLFLLWFLFCSTCFCFFFYY